MVVKKKSIKPVDRESAPEEEGTPADHPLVLQFMDLFKCNQRSIIKYDPNTGRVWSELHTVSRELWADHLQGKMGLGGSPILDDHTCHWAGIDIDNHDTPEEDLPIPKIWDDIQAQKLPLIPCRTKSGGVHCYVFFEEPQPAARVRHILASWARRIGYPKAEVFPKQSTLRSGDGGGRQLGMAMNWPYFGGANTNRWAYHEGRKLSAVSFLKLAEQMRVSNARMKLALIEGHQEAPPCLQKLYMDGVPPGYRNEAMYDFVVYLKKAFPETLALEAAEVNHNVFTKPLPRAEFTRTLNSASRPECKYRCQEEPIKSLCERERCQTLKYGISKDEYETLAATEAIPPFTDLVKYLAEPVKWEIKMDGRTVAGISTAQLLDWRSMREIIADKLTRVVPMIKPQDWERVLQPLMKEARLVETPEDASINGAIRSRLREFAAKTDLMNKGENPDDRRAVLRGLPCVQLYQGERVVMFRQIDFVNYLKKSKAEELKGVALWMAVKEMGLGHTKLRIGKDVNINLWYIPIREVLNDIIPPDMPEYKSEL